MVVNIRINSNLAIQNLCQTARIGNYTKSTLTMCNLVCGLSDIFAMMSVKLQKSFTFADLLGGRVPSLN